MNYYSPQPAQNFNCWKTAVFLYLQNPSANHLSLFAQQLPTSRQHHRRQHHFQNITRNEGDHAQREDVVPACELRQPWQTESGNNGRFQQHHRHRAAGCDQLLIFSASPSASQYLFACVSYSGLSPQRAARV